ncbi:MAG: bifunctional diguanylate cyclase/phosphodiesterase [Gallionella sp.]|jgi:EAL domain-containing protein (putative c-di-GMP-specific phosphodiesterase class I)/GGDEF domain-containing protein/PAS domain-containing protein
MLQRKIWLAFLLVLMVGIAVSARIVYLGDSVQATNRMFVAEKLPLSQRIGELRGVIADEERLLYEYYSYTASRDVFLAQRTQNKQRLGEIVARLKEDAGSQAEVAELSARLVRMGQLSDELSDTLAKTEVDWDRARALLGQIKPQVRQIEKTLAVITQANQQAVSDLGDSSQNSVSTMVRSVIGFAVLIFGVAFFVGYYVVAIIREGAERRRLALFAERDPNPVLRLNAAGDVLYANPATDELLRHLGLAKATLVLPLDLKSHLAATRESLNTRFEYTHGERTLECTVAFLADFAEFHVYLKDVSARKVAEERLEYQAFFDAATGLPNQYKLHEELTLAFKEKREGSVMMIVADREQEILESFGAAETEKWLVKVAQRLGYVLNGRDEKLYRFGSNAFVLVRLPCNLSAVQQRAGALLSAARQPLQIDGYELFSTLSVGAAFIHADSDAVHMAKALVQQAASACNRVRRAGGNDFAVYDEAMSRAAFNALHLAADLQHAVENNELRLQYQPKVDAATGRLLGMEALVRWMHPERGMISPVEFIPVAEDTGLIVGIGRWVLFEACRQNREWQTLGLRPLRVAVNLSARQFRAGNLLSEIDSVLAQTGLPVDSLELEVTESMVMDDPESVIRLLGAIHDRGIHLALDDFGTGHSSLAYLKRFPIDCVKIDRAFIKDTPGNTDDVAIARTIIAMAEALGLSTVAEGVETAEQAELIKAMGCGQIQGYFYSRPLPADDFLAYYRAHH